MAKRRESLKVDDDNAVLARWLTWQVRKMHVLNAALVLANLGLMVGGRWMVKNIGFMPKIRQEWAVDAGNSASSFFNGSMELYLIFSFAWLLQQLIGLLYRSFRSLCIGYLGLLRAASRLATYQCSCLRGHTAKWGVEEEQRTWRLAYETVRIA